MQYLPISVTRKSGATPAGLRLCLMGGSSKFSMGRRRRGVWEPIPVIGVQGQSPGGDLEAEAKCFTGFLIKMHYILMA